MTDLGLSLDLTEPASYSPVEAVAASQRSFVEGAPSPRPRLQFRPDRPRG